MENGINSPESFPGCPFVPGTLKLDIGLKIRDKFTEASHDNNIAALV